MNNVLTVLNTLLRIAVDFDAFAQLVDAAKRMDSRTYVAVLLGGEAG